MGWRWSQYIVAIIDGVVLILLFLSFEETLFPRFLFSGSVQSTFSSPVDEEGKLSSQPTTANVSNGYHFPSRNFAERVKLWSYYHQDRTSYWQYFRRPFFLLRFPNVIIVRYVSEMMETTTDINVTGWLHLCFRLYSWNRLVQHDL